MRRIRIATFDGGLGRLSALMAVVLGVLLAGPALAVEPVNKTVFGGVAIDGYDPVAYFTDGKPMEGSKEFSLRWHDAEWRFASVAHRDLFAADPEKYAPQYGGYCAWAVAQGDTADIDPEAWRIVDGKLYLNYNQKIQARWAEDIPGNVAAADRNWPRLVSEK